MFEQEYLSEYDLVTQMIWAMPTSNDLIIDSENPESPVNENVTPQVTMDNDFLPNLLDMEDLLPYHYGSEDVEASSSEDDTPIIHLLLKKRKVAQIPSVKNQVIRKPANKKRKPHRPHRRRTFTRTTKKRCAKCAGDNWKHGSDICTQCLLNIPL